MLELLKRFEEESAEDAEALEEEEDESDLSRRFASVDLGASPVQSPRNTAVFNSPSIQTLSRLTLSGLC